MADLSFNEIRRLVNAALGKDTYIEDIFPSEVIYSQGYTEGSRRFKRSFAIADGRVTLGEAVEVQRKVSYEPVKTATFSLSGGTISGDWVTREGKLFELGSYPDKNFSLDEHEADNQALAGFSDAPNDLEHVKTILSGKLGKVTQLWRQGRALFGKVEIPKWLHEVHPEPIGCSLTFDRRTKRVIGNALVLDPRVTDAKIRAAFSAASDGQEAMSEQQFTEEEATGLKKFLAYFSGKKGAEDNPTPNSEIAELRKDVADMKAAFSAHAGKTSSDDEKAKADQGRISAAAAEFADSVIKDRKALPAERDGIIAAFTAAASSGGENFVLFANSELQECAGLKAFKNAYTSRTPNRLGDNAIQVVDFRNGDGLAEDGTLPISEDAYAMFGKGREKAS